MERKRDDGTTVEVEYDVTSWGSPAAWTSYGGDPSEAATVEITAVYDEDGEDVELTEAERERIEQEISEIVEQEGPPDDFD